jgi:hypothetical protein
VTTLLAGDYNSNKTQDASYDASCYYGSATDSTKNYCLYAECYNPTTPGALILANPQDACLCGTQGGVKRFVKGDYVASTTPVTYVSSCKDGINSTNAAVVAGSSNVNLSTTVSVYRTECADGLPADNTVFGLGHLECITNHSPASTLKRQVTSDSLGATYYSHYYYCRGVTPSTFFFANVAGTSDSAACLGAENISGKFVSSNAGNKLVSTGEDPSRTTGSGYQGNTTYSTPTPTPTATGTPAGCINNIPCGSHVFFVYDSDSPVSTSATDADALCTAYANDNLYPGMNFKAVLSDGITGPKERLESLIDTSGDFTIYDIASNSILTVADTFNELFTSGPNTNFLNITNAAGLTPTVSEYWTGAVATDGSGPADTSIHSCSDWSDLSVGSSYFGYYGTIAANGPWICHLSDACSTMRGFLCVSTDPAN